MEPFLKLVAKDLYNLLGSKLSDITLVFPNRRASLFFARYLAEQLSSPTWQPAFTTVNELMYKVAGLRPANNLWLNYKLYQSYTDITGINQPFDDFYFWGNVMLSDFDQVDKYQVDPQKIFANIKDIKDIDRRFDEFDAEHVEAIKKFLNLIDDHGSSAIRSRYSEIWSKLGVIYSQLRERLLQEGTAYEGLAYRMASEEMNKSQLLTLNERFALIGFNALNACEKTLFNHLKNFNNALFYWDYDKYYMQNQDYVHEAAFFMSDNLKSFPGRLDSSFFDSLQSGKVKNVNLIASPSKVAQAKIISNILNKLGYDDENLGINTAIVLPEEQLLLPVISALPTNLDEVNITMGYPINDTFAYSLADGLISLQANLKTAGTEVKFYNKDVLNLLSHPYVAQLAKEESKSISATIVQQKSISVDGSYFKDSPLLSKIFSQASYLPTYLLDVIKTVSGGLASLENDRPESIKLELEFLFAIYKALNGLDGIISQFDTTPSPRTFRSIFRRAMAEQRVSFYGEPLSGIQLMGFLETRSLDFENVIILSLNDGVLPGPSNSPSFITPSIRKAYGLPDYRHQNAIYAYYFYRLLQRASNIYMVYTNSSESMRTGEVSRYVLQLLMESNLKINRIQVKFDLGITPDGPISVSKTDRVMAILERYLANGQSSKYLSPTAMVAYKNCKLRFFFSHVAGFKEPEEMDEAIDERGVGIILHRAIELIYDGIKSSVTSTSVGAILKNDSLIEANIRKAYAENFNVDLSKFDEVVIGRNALLLERIKWMVRQMLVVDMKRTPYSITRSEQSEMVDIPIVVDGRNFAVKLGGRIDRVEQANGLTRIIDFKTGKFEPNKVTFSEIDQLFENKSNTDGILQLFAYCMIYSMKYGIDAGSIQPNLWYVRKNTLPLISKSLKKGNSAKTEVTTFESLQAPFRQMLVALLEEIFNPSVDFTQTDNTDNCKICPYNAICNRV